MEKRVPSRSIIAESAFKKPQPDEAQQMLLTFVSRLHDHMSVPYPLFPDKVADWLIVGISHALISGESLDTALGLKRGRGRPKPGPGVHFETAKQVHRLLCLDGDVRPSWGEIASIVDWQGETKDLKDAYRREREAVVRYFADQIIEWVNEGE